MGANAEFLRLMEPELGLLLPMLDERSRRLVLATAPGPGSPPRPASSPPSAATASA